MSADLSEKLLFDIFKSLKSLVCWKYQLIAFYCLPIYLNIDLCLETMENYGIFQHTNCIKHAVGN